MGALFLAVNSGAQTVDVPIVVPLHFTQITSGTHKLGIYVRFKTTSVVDAGNVGIQNKEEDLDYFMNTGISLFYAYDIIYNLKDGEIGLLEVPVIGETRAISETDLEACIRLGSNQRFFEKNRVLGRFGDLCVFHQNPYRYPSKAGWGGPELTCTRPLRLREIALAQFEKSVLFPAQVRALLGRW